MLVIFGVTVPKEKRIAYALPILYGIGLYSSKKICNELGFAEGLKVSDLTEEQQFDLIRKLKEEYRLENNLREEIKGNVQRYMNNGSIRGFRHKNKLPVRGQRTKTNAKTARRVILGISIKK